MFRSPLDTQGFERPHLYRKQQLILEGCTIPVRRLAGGGILKKTDYKAVLQYVDIICITYFTQGTLL